MKKKIDDSWQDGEFGNIYLSQHMRCKRLNARCYEGGILLTVPPGYSRSTIQGVLENIRPQIRQMLERYNNRQQRKPLIDWSFQIQTDSFRLFIKPSHDSNFYIHHENYQEAWLLCPAETDFPLHQEFLIKSIEECIRQHAKEYFPGLLKQLVHEHRFSVSGLKVKKMHSRWGSCSSTKEIHISIYVLLLPLHLQQLILLHELCHTVHMNHGPKFHALLNQVTAGNEAKWNAELKRYKTDILSFV